MKLFKTLLLTAVAASLVTVANAQTVFRITGSTAYRGSVVNAIANSFGAGGFRLAYSGTSGANGASDQIFSGTYALSGTFGTVPVTVICHWSGSEGGIQTVAGASSAVNHANFLSLTTPMSSGTAAGDGAGSGGTITGGTQGVTSGTDSEIPDATMSDSYQAASQFLGTYHSVSYAPLTEDANSPVGVNPFVFVAGGGTNTTPSFVGTGTNPTNITANQAKELLTAGVMPMSFFSNNAGC